MKHLAKCLLSKKYVYRQCGVCNQLYLVKAASKSSKSRTPVWKNRCPDHEVKKI